MRKLTVMLFCALSIVSVYAGDVAHFVNLGFSSDGKSFVFGQYGVTDSEYHAYADIYSIDVAKNSYVSGGTFSIAPGSEESAKEGSVVFAALQTRAASSMKKLGIEIALQGRAIYIQAEDEPQLKKLMFRDFETGTMYTIKINSLVEGKGSSVRSSFYLVVDIVGADGKKTTKTIGSPSFKRDGVKDYLIRKIITDPNGKSLVFVIEKELFEKNGSSIRFMVETVRL